MRMDGALVDIGGRRLFYRLAGEGEPTVVFVCGSDDAAESLAGLAELVRPLSRTLLYDRAGLGRSDPGPLPRTLDGAADDLRALLAATGVGGQVLLVGHSYGGLVARLYAARHRADVAGLVLLDVPHPELALRELGCLPPPAPGEPAVLAELRTSLEAEWDDPSANAEGIDFRTSAAPLAAAGDLGDMPLVVVTAGIDQPFAGIPPEVARASAEDWMACQRELLTLSANSTHVIATESDHSIQDCQPELVVEIVAAMIARWRGVDGT
jgi:pimeloyl-ACP methyl ester carboxylesterase